MNKLEIETYAKTNYNMQVLSLHWSSDNIYVFNHSRDLYPPNFSPIRSTVQENLIILE